MFVNLVEYLFPQTGFKMWPQYTALGKSLFVFGCCCQGGNVLPAQAVVSNTLGKALVLASAGIPP